MALTPGTRIGAYEVIAQIGVGGMGEVYQATDTNLKRGVAIKVLPETVAADAERLARFQREAEVLAALNHPNIAAIYGLERTGITTAIAMELVEGPTLADRIAQGPLPLDEALPIAKQIADALEAAHEQGIVHRDLKPANIKVRHDGVVKVLDFGLAKAAGPASAMSIGSSMSPTITTPAMTQAGLILGTAAYMSPEQARGKPVDKRSDIWAFGCVLFEMLTGRRAFNGEDVGLTLAEVMKSEPDWTRLPALPSPVRICLRRCLKKDPRLRLRDIGEARLALDGAIDVDDASAVVAPGRSARVWAWVLPSAIVAAIVGAALTLWLRPSALPEVVRFEIHAPEGFKIPPGTPAISPDGRTLAYVATDAPGTRRIFLRDLGSIESRVLAGTDDATYVFWAPDGRSLAFTSDRALKRVDIAGGSPRDLAQRVSAPWQGAWGQSGDVLFLAGGMLRVPAEGGPTTPALHLNQSRQDLRAAFPFFLSDGRRFLFLTTAADGRAAIQLASLESPELKIVLPGALSAPVVAPTPMGQAYLLYARDDSLVAQEFDERTGQVSGSPRTVVDGIGKVANPPLRPTVGVSPSGVVAFQTGGEYSSRKLTWLDRAGRVLGDVPLEVSPNAFSLSPDGGRLAFVADSRGEVDVWVTDLNRNNTLRLTLTPETERSPVWSPDGNRIAYSKAGKIFVRGADGLSDETVLADVGGTVRDWSADGKYLLYSQAESSGGGRLFLWPLMGGAPIPLGRVDGTSRDGRFSPDSGYVAYISNETGIDEIYIEAVPPLKARTKVSQGGGTTPRWGAASREVFFYGADRTVMVADVQLGPTLSAAMPRRLIGGENLPDRREFEVSPDGQRFLVKQLAAEAPDTPITVVLNWWVELARKKN